MTERFDLEKWLSRHDVSEMDDSLWLPQLVAAAENHQRELMDCGHRRACWVEDKDSLSHLDSFYRKQIDKGMFNEDQVDSLKRDNSYCTVCAELSRVSERTAAKDAEIEALADCVKDYAERTKRLSAALYKKLESGLMLAATELNGGEYKEFVTHAIMPIVLGTVARALESE